VAKLPGSDLKLKDEYVVVSAHRFWDVAAAIQSSKAKPKRSLLFLFVTAEEKGLLGSRYYAAHLTVPKSSIIADLNTDMFLPIIPLKVLTVQGLAESDLGDDAREVQPDPVPLRNSFVRSDQYSFIRQGTPSLAMSVGAVNGSPEAAIKKKWLTERYHAPSDDLNQPVDLAAAGKFEDVMDGPGAEGGR